MIMKTVLRGGSIAVVSAFALLGSAVQAQAQLVDTPQNLLKAWTEAYAKRAGEPMTKLYSKDAQLWGSQSKEPSIGMDAIKQHYDRTGQAVTERSATVGKMLVAPRKRVTQVVGTMELKAKLKDGTARTNEARFSMSIIRESRRQYSIISHHVSLVPTN
jgi:ketosteroid isomerase-like protein